jgi:hypothetical protein
MIEAQITIDRDLAIKGYKRAYGIKALREGAAFYNFRAFYVFLAVAVADVLYGGGHLIGVHLLVITALAIGASLYHYFDWLRKLSATMKDYELHVVLDDDGVTIKNDGGKRIAWSAYAYFKEYEDYLEITGAAGEVSLLPKRDELAKVIVFTKTKIPNKDFEK